MFYRYMYAGVHLRGCLFAAAAASVLPLSCNAAMLPDGEETPAEEPAKPATKKGKK